jgi:hypothetical protein
MTYLVRVDDNARYMDESARYTLGQYETLTDAQAAARTLVDADLASFYQPGMSADELFRYHVTFGADPFIVPDDERTFSARDYARARCDEMCQRAAEPDEPA